MFLKVRGSVSLTSGNTTEIEIELRFFSKSKMWNYFELTQQAEIELGHFLKRQPEEEFSVRFISNRDKAYCPQGPQWSSLDISILLFIFLSQ
jgi:hypothetical protein